MDRTNGERVSWFVGFSAGFFLGVFLHVFVVVFFSYFLGFFFAQQTFIYCLLMGFQVNETFIQCDEVIILYFEHVFIPGAGGNTSNRSRRRRRNVVVVKCDGS